MSYEIYILPIMMSYNIQGLKVFTYGARVALISKKPKHLL